MKIRQTKIKAFSLQEMMVVLVITTVVVGMAVLNLVQRQMGSIETIYAIKTDVNQLRQSLWIDFSRYSYVHFDNKNNELRFSNEMGERTYVVLNESSISNENLEIEIESIAFYFDNQQVLYGEIDAISITTSKDTGHQEIFAFKENTPATYINQQ